MRWLALLLILLLVSPAFATSVTVDIFGTNASNAQSNLTKTGTNTYQVVQWIVGDATKSLKADINGNASDSITFTLHNFTAERVIEVKINSTSFNAYRADSTGTISFIRTQTIQNQTYSFTPAVNAGGFNFSWGWFNDIVASNTCGVSYCIGQLGSIIYAKNGSTGAVDYSGTVVGTVFNSTITKVNTNGGGDIFVKKGNYTLSQNNEFIDISNTTGITIYGESGTILIYNRTDTGAAYPDIFKAYAPISKFEISNIEFKLNQSKTDGNAHSYISINPVPAYGEDINIHHIFVNNSAQDFTTAANDYAPSFGIQVHGVKIAKVTDNILLNFSYYPIEVETTDGASILRNIVTAHQYGLTGGGNAQRNTVIAYNDISPPISRSAMTTGIEWESAGGQVIICCNSIRNATGTAGIRVYRSDLYTVADPEDVVDIYSNILTNTKLSIYVKNYAEVSIHDNILINNTGQITVVNSTNVSVYDNHGDNRLDTTYTNNTRVTPTNYGNRTVAPSTAFDEQFGDRYQNYTSKDFTCGWDGSQWQNATGNTEVC